MATAFELAISVKSSTNSKRLASGKSSGDEHSVSPMTQYVIII